VDGDDGRQFTTVARESPALKTLLYSGGGVHDAQGCGDAIGEALAGVAELDVTRSQDDRDCFVAANMAGRGLAVVYHTGPGLEDAQRHGLLDWVRDGGGFVGVHSAADSFRDCPDYVAMIGGEFITHPHYRQYLVSVADAEHPVTAGLTEFWVEDEQYVTAYDPRNQVLATALHQGKITPVVWVKSWGSGRVCWIALGHDPQACRQEIFVTLLQRACLWAGRQDAGG
jgi:hypothetical protein